MTLTLSMFAFSDLGQSVRALFAQPVTPKTYANSEDESTRKDRAFFLEMMARNPEAVQSELGCMAMMTQYPRYF